MFRTILNTLASHQEHCGFLQNKQFPWDFCPHCFSAWDRRNPGRALCSQLPSMEEAPLHESHLLLPAQSQEVPRVSQGCVWVCPRGRAREGWPEPSRAREELVPHPLWEGFGNNKGETPWGKMHMQQGAASGWQLPLAGKWPHLCPLQEGKELSPGAPGRSGARGTFHLMRILFILSGATNLSSEHFVLIKN